MGPVARSRAWSGGWGAGRRRGSGRTARSHCELPPALGGVLGWNGVQESHDRRKCNNITKIRPFILALNYFTGKF